MKLGISVITCALVTNLAFAQGQVTVMPDEPSTGAEEAVIVAAAPALRKARREKLASLGLLGSGVAMTVTGGLLIGYHNGSDGALDSGVAFTAVGGAAVLGSLYLGVASAGHDAGLRRLRLFAAAPPDERTALVDDVEARVRRGEVTGIALFVTGLALFGAGFGMAVAGLGDPFGEGPSGNGGLFVTGIAFSVLGDASWLAGSLTWAYKGAEHAGIREARRALTFAPTGVSGSF